MKSDADFRGSASRDDAVARAVKEAGWSGIYTQFVSATEQQSLTVPVTPEQVRKFYELAYRAGAAAKADACARMAENRALAGATKQAGAGHRAACMNIASDIRAGRAE